MIYYPYSADAPDRTTVPIRSFSSHSFRFVSTNSVQSPGVITQAERPVHSLKALLRMDIAPMMQYVQPVKWIFSW